VALLQDLRDQLGGALAVVSGRQIDAIDRFLAPLRLPAAGEHGVQRRDAKGHMQEQRAPDLVPILDIANELARVHEGLLVERKHAAIALHYRLAPQLEAVCRDAMSRAIDRATRSSNSCTASSCSRSSPRASTRASPSTRS
jgi:trehalose 6-phosphate phosphatase